MGNELLVIEKEKALVIFRSGNVDPLIEAAKQIVVGFKHDLSTGVGRKKTASLAAKVSTYKVKLDEMRKDLVSDWKEKAKKVDQSGKILRDQLDDLRDEARKPLTDWEDAEKSRVGQHRDVIDCILTFSYDSSHLLSEIDYLRIELYDIEKTVVDSKLEEFELEATKAKENSISELNILIQKEEDRIKKDLEIAQLKKEKEESDQKERDERLQREAAERATKDAEERARIEAAKIEKEKQEAIFNKKVAEKNAEDQERRRIQSEERAKIDNENAVENARIAQANADQEKRDAIEKTKREATQRQEFERQQEEDRKVKRESDIAHAGEIMKSSKECLMEFVDESTAKRIVLAIKNGKIKNVVINF